VNQHIKPNVCLQLLFILFVAACSEVAATNPYDDNTPSAQQATGRIRGKISLPQEYPLDLSSRAVVTLIRLKETNETDEIIAPIASSGDFTVENLTESPYQVIYALEGFKEQTETVFVERGKTANLPDRLMEPKESNYTGRVKLEDNPASGDVSITAFLGTNLVASYSTGPSGLFAIRLTQREHNVKFEASGYVSRELAIKWDEARKQFVDSQTPERETSTIQLERIEFPLEVDGPRTLAPRATGQLRISGGKSPYTVSYPNETPATGPDAETTSAGAFRLGGTGNTEETLVVRDSAGQEQTHTIVVTPSLNLERATMALQREQVGELNALGGAPPYRFFSTEPERVSVDELAGLYRLQSDAVDFIKVGVVDSNGATRLAQVARRFTVPTGGDPFAPLDIDIDGDGKKEFLHSAPSNGSYRIYKSSQAGSYELFSEQRLNLAITSAMTIANFGRDRQLLVLAGADNSTNEWTLRVYSINPLNGTMNLECLHSVEPLIRYLDVFSTDPRTQQISFIAGSAEGKAAESFRLSLSDGSCALTRLQHIFLPKEVRSVAVGSYWGGETQVAIALRSPNIEKGEVRFYTSGNESILSEAIERRLRIGNGAIRMVRGRFSQTQLDELAIMSPSGWQVQFATRSPINPDAFNLPENDQTPITVSQRYVPCSEDNECPSGQVCARRSPNLENRYCMNPCDRSTQCDEGEFCSEDPTGALEPRDERKRCIPYSGISLVTISESPIVEVSHRPQAIIRYRHASGHDGVITTGLWGLDVLVPMGTGDFFSPHVVQTYRLDRPINNVVIPDVIDVNGDGSDDLRILGRNENQTMDIFHGNPPSMATLSTFPIKEGALSFGNEARSHIHPAEILFTLCYNGYVEVFSLEFRDTFTVAWFGTNCPDLADVNGDHYLDLVGVQAGIGVSLFDPVTRQFNDATKHPSGDPDVTSSTLSFSENRRMLFTLSGVRASTLRAYSFDEHGNPIHAIPNTGLSLLDGDLQYSTVVSMRTSSNRNHRLLVTSHLDTTGYMQVIDVRDDGLVSIGPRQRDRAPGRYSEGFPIDCDNDNQDEFFVTGHSPDGSPAVELWRVDDSGIMALIGGVFPGENVRAVGDFNFDGNMDVITSEAVPSEPGIDLLRIFAGAGSCHFREPIELESSFPVHVIERFNRNAAIVDKTLTQVRVLELDEDADTTFRIPPKSGAPCSPCVSDDDCGDSDNRCVIQQDRRRFCARLCTNGRACADGYTCTPLSDSADSYCAPNAGVCTNE